MVPCRGLGSTLTDEGLSLQIGDLRFFRSTEYQEMFNELDQAGGFYTERVSPRL